MDVSSISAISQYPVLYAFAIGIITALGPCPLSANITAIAYVSSKMTDSKNTILAGISYTIGRALTYAAIGIMIFMFGTVVMDNAPALQDYEKLLFGLILVIAGIIMLEVYKPNIFIGDGLKTKFGIRLADKGIFGAFFMGSVFALAFCPYTAVMFFGLLIPLSIQSDITGMSFPILFGIGTGLPVLLFAILLGISSAFARVYVKKLSRIEPYIRKPIGAIFMIYGAYMLIIFISRVFFLRP